MTVKPEDHLQGSELTEFNKHMRNSVKHLDKALSMLPESERLEHGDGLNARQSLWDLLNKYFPIPF